MQQIAPLINLGSTLKAGPDQAKFGRAFNAHEWQGYQEAINRAKTRLGVKQLAMVTPIRSLPTPINTGVGSLHAGQPFLRFVQKLGFTHIQLDPVGAVHHGNICPYAGTLFSYNPWQIDLKALESSKWGELLPEGTTELIAAGNKEVTRFNVEHVAPRYKEALHMAFESFLEKRKSLAKQSHDFQVLALSFEAYKKQHTSWLLPDGLYEILGAKEYANVKWGDYWKNWVGPYAHLDKVLFTPDNKVQKQKRIEVLQKKYAHEIENYAFTQFLISKQQQVVNENCKISGLTLMADKPIGFSDRDNWANQHLFLKNWSIGTPPDQFSAVGQTWNFPVIDPKHLYNPDGTVNPNAEGTQLLKRIYAKLFQDFHGLRIDYAMGMIDPWVYPTNAKNTLQGTRLFSSPEHPELGKYSHINRQAINENVPKDSRGRIKKEALSNPKIFNRYAGLLKTVILDEAKKAGIPTENVIFEDIGDVTTPILKVIEVFKLGGMRVSQYANPHDPDCILRPKNSLPESWAITATHDSPSTKQWLKTLSLKDKLHHAERLAEDLFPQDHTYKKDVVKSLFKDTQLFIDTLFTELFLAPAQNVQIFFADWLGMSHTYNRAGLYDNANNWRLRIPQQFEKAYFDSVKVGKGINLPQILSQAIQLKSLSSPKQNVPTDDAELIKILNYYSEVLKQ